MATWLAVEGRAFGPVVWATLSKKCDLGGRYCEAVATERRALRLTLSQDFGQVREECAPKGAQEAWGDTLEN